MVGWDGVQLLSLIDKLICPISGGGAVQLLSLIDKLINPISGLVR